VCRSEYIRQARAREAGALEQLVERLLERRAVAVLEHERVGRPPLAEPLHQRPELIIHLQLTPHADFGDPHAGVVVRFAAGTNLLLDSDAVAREIDGAAAQVEDLVGAHPGEEVHADEISERLILAAPREESRALLDGEIADGLGATRIAAFILREPNDWRAIEIFALDGEVEDGAQDLELLYPMH
jgi:hypothetical protein